MFPYYLDQLSVSLSISDLTAKLDKLMYDPLVFAFVFAASYEERSAKLKSRQLETCTV